MRRSRSLVLFVSLLAVVTATAQQPSPSAAQAPQRDPQALTILNQALAASGGSTLVASIQDFTATGTIICFWAGEDVPGSVSIYSKGVEFRMDAHMPAGTQSLIVDGTVGTFQPLNGQKILLPSTNGITAGSLTFPAKRISSALSNASTNLSYLGLVNWNGSQIYRVHVAPLADPALSTNGKFGTLGSFDLYIDTASYRVLELAETIWWDGDVTKSYSHELMFSNYTSTNGLSVPFSITEKFGGQQTWSATLTSITFNSGLSDSLFSL
jgi:hypothetical protein